MPAVVLNDPKMERRIRIDNQLVDQLEQVAETVQVGQQATLRRSPCLRISRRFFLQYHRGYAWGKIYHCNLLNEFFLKNTFSKQVG